MPVEDTQNKVGGVNTNSGLSRSQSTLPALSPKYVKLAGYDNNKIMMLCQWMAQCLGLNRFLPNEKGQQALLDYINGIETAILQARREMVSETNEINLETAFVNVMHQDSNSDSAFKNLNMTGIEPHLQLFLTFLSLLKYPQQQLNDVTQRHMDFYYQQVLKFKAKSAEGQQVLVCFELSKGVQEYQLKRGTKLLAQRQTLSDGIKSLLTNASQPQYVLDSQISVNRAQITQVRTILASENQVKKRFDISIGNEFTPFSLQASHQTIGNNSQEKMPATENNYNLNTLFLSSPLLMCQQGKRTFTLDHFNVSSLQDYDIFISTKEGWLYIGDSEDVKTNDEPSYVLDSSILTIILPPTVPALIPPGESLESIHPVIQMVPRRGAPALELDYVELSVEVNGITDINFTNDDGNFKNDGDFNVFGAEPSVGASLYFRCSDIANMPITNLSLNMNWVPGALPNLELSEGGSGVPNIDGIYKNYYIPNKPDAGEGSDSLIHPGDQYIDEFIIDLQNANGIEIQLGSAQTVSKKLFQKTIKWSDIKHQDTNFETLKISLSKGDFLYSQYFVSQNIQAQKLAKDNVNKILAAIGAAPEPNDDGSPSVNKVIYPPYTPATRPISLDYNTGPDKVNLQYINEFGQLQDSAESLDGYQSNANENGILFKISPILKDQSVSVLLAIKNQNNPSDLQSIDASQLKVRWHYYLPKKKGDSGEVPEVESGWQAFIPKTQWNKQYDYCLLTLNKPEELSEDEIWIKASISNGLLLSNTNLIYLYTQVVLASEVIDENHYFPVPLAKNNIRSFVQSNNKISTIRQPLASFGGSTKQSEWQLSKAASNRLKNRDRAITPSDYESLVLNQFPQVERVVCDRACQDSAGIVSILITPKKITYNEKGFSLAGSQLLISIKKFLESRSSQAVSLTVGFDGNDQ